jgi:hypothetical protein
MAYAASRSYSGMTLPNTSRRLTTPHLALGAEGIGGCGPSPRCGRARVRIGNEEQVV